MRSIYFKLSDENDETIKFTSHKDNTKFALIAGKALNEPFAKKANYVMNTEEEIEQALKDRAEGKNGFEGADTWKSKIRELSSKYQKKAED